MEPVTAVTVTAKVLQGLCEAVKLLWEGYSAAQENQHAAEAVQKFCDGFKAQPGSSSSTDPMEEVVQKAKALLDEYDKAKCMVFGKKLFSCGKSNRGAACFRCVTSSFWNKKFVDTLTKIQQHRGERTLSVVLQMGSTIDDMDTKISKLMEVNQNQTAEIQNQTAEIKKLEGKIDKSNDLLERLVAENRQREEGYTSLKKVTRELETFAKEVPAKLDDRRVLEWPFAEELAPVERMAIPQEVRKTEGPDSVEAKLLKLREELNRLEEEHPSTDLVKEAEEYLARNTRTGDDIVGTSSSMKN